MYICSNDSKLHKMMEIIEREISGAVIEAAKVYSVVTITGPRQSGKTTLAKHLFSSLPYFSLESPDVRGIAMSDPIGFLKSGQNGIVIDEIQHFPQLLSYIQTLVDERQDLRYVLTGSSDFTLMKSVTQSLTGRTAVFELLPLSLGETGIAASRLSLEELLFRGMYPAAWSRGISAEILYPNYVKTYLERDVRDLLSVKDINTFRKFLRLCACRIGSIFNASELSCEIGVSGNTIKSWLDVLMTSYVIVLLQPFHSNTHKRLIKSPKIYFSDTGLACSLLDIESAKQLGRDKMRGHLFENMIVIEALKSRLNKGKGNNLCFYRDSNGNEVDLITKSEGRLNLYEIKSSETYHQDFEKGLKAFRKAFPEFVGSQTVVYNGQTEIEDSEIRVVNFRRKLF